MFVKQYVRIFKISKKKEKKIPFNLNKNPFFFLVNSRCCIVNRKHIFN